MAERTLRVPRRLFEELAAIVLVRCSDGLGLTELQRSVLTVERVEAALDEARRLLGIRLDRAAGERAAERAIYAKYAAWLRAAGGSRGG